MGEWEDEAWGNIEHSFPEMSFLFSNDPTRWSIRGSERYEDVVSRVTEFIRETAKRHDGETIAMFSHGFAIRVFFCNLFGLRSDEIGKVLYCDNTAVALLIYDNDTFTIDYQSDNSHLSQETSTFARQKWWRVAANALSENLRYVPLEKERDAELIDAFLKEQGEKAMIGADKEYTAFFADEPAVDV